MSINVFKLSLILAIASSSPAWADDVKAVAAEPSSVDEKMANDGKATAAVYESQHATIMKDCGVDPANEKQLHAVLQSWDEVTKSIVGSTKKESPDLLEKLAVLDKEIDAAKQSNNPDMVQDLSQKRIELVNLMNGWDPDTQKQLDEVDVKYRGAVRELVSEDKLDRLDEILEAAQDTQPNRPRKGPIRSPRALKAIVDRLGDLTPEQRRTIDAVFQQFRESQRENRGQSPDNAAKHRKLYDDVFAVLTDGQKTRVEQQLSGRATTAAPEAPKAPATAGNAAATAAPSSSEGAKKPAAIPTPPAKPAGEKP